MSQTGPWSVKGIDQRARDAAREAASAEGLTLGEYLNRLLMSAEAPRPNEVSAPYESRRLRPDAASSTIDKLTKRIEATEARSTLAITGMDHTILGLVARLEDSEHNTASMTGHVESLLDELRETHEALQAKVRRMEQDNSARENLEALKSLEEALGKLASHVFEENELAQNEAQAIKGRVEAGFSNLNERVEGVETRVEDTLSKAAARVEKAVEQAELRAEGTARQLSERLTALEGQVNESMSTSGTEAPDLEAMNARISEAVNSMDSKMEGIQNRLNRAEAATDTALQSLESTYSQLDEKIGTLSESVDPDIAQKLREEFNARFEDITRSVRETVDKARQDLVEEISRAASADSSEAVDELRSQLGTVEERISSSEERQNRAIEDVSGKVGDLSSSLDQRLQDIESRDDALTSDTIRQEISQFGDMVSERMDDMAGHVDKRVKESEQRSADAISQIGDQVAKVATRLQVRQDKALQTLATQIDENRKDSDNRLSDALSNVSERLEQIQTQTTNSLSPLQKAITSLATRLESLEDVTAPAYGTPLMDTPSAGADLTGGASSFDEPRTEEIETSEFEADFEPGIPDTDFPEPEQPAQNDEWGLTDHLAQKRSPYEEDIEEDGAPFMELEDENEDDDELGLFFETASDFDTTGNIQATEGHDSEGDPLFALIDPDDSHTEARDSDIFDSEAFEDGIDTQDFMDEAEEHETTEAETEAPSEAHPEEAENYIAMARRAAIAASTGAPSARRDKTVPAKANRSNSKMPLYAAASAVVITGAAVGGYLYLRGTQDAPQVSTAATPQDTPSAIPASEDIAPETEDVSFGADLPQAAETEAETPSPATGDMDDILFDREAEAAPVTETSPETAISPDAAANPSIMSATIVQKAPTYEPIPETDTLEGAASAGNPVARFTLAQQYLSEGQLQEGADLMQEAAASGLAIAQYRLSKLHEKGTGVPKDLALARQWTERAAVNGNVNAMHDLAVFMAQGDGGPQSYAGAVEWFRQAAEYGIVDSQYNLGILYEEGLGISPNLSEALYWFSVAAQNGDAAAPAKVRELSAKLSPQAAATVQNRAELWNAAPSNNMVNGHFALQSWQLGNPQQVRAIQTALNTLGYNAGTPDGILGASTATAIREYQSDSGLKTSGRVTEELIEQLNAGA
ncbi:peptidoglycan-binding protein [Hyphomonas beringensis]|nr:peptidoglycan-binding protein [Hyphomonas beringensis]